MRLAVPLVALLATAACAGGARTPASSTAPAPATRPPATASTAPPDSGGFFLQPPREAAGFRLRGRRTSPDPKTGTQFRYVDARGRGLDVYVYAADPRLSSCGTACADSSVREEAQGFISLIPQFIAQGYFGAATVGTNEAIARPADAGWVAGWFVALDGTKDGGRVRSDYYLYHLPGYRVKVRASYVDDPAVRDEVRRFAAELAEGFARAPRRPAL